MHIFLLSRSGRRGVETKWKAISEAVLESGWLIALAAIPAYFDSQTVRIFDANKILYFQAVVLAMTPFLILYLLERFTGAKGRPSFSFWRLPLVRPAFFIVAMLSLSTFFSIAPGVSLWGSYNRMQGLFTWLCYLLFFLSLVLVVRRRAQVDRIIDVLLLSSVYCCAYALFQYFGIDSVTWTVAFGRRIDGTLGNPIFLGAFLIMIMPLTILRTWAAGQRLFLQWPEGRQGGRRWSAAVVFGAYLMLFAVQSTCFALAESRGPFLGLAAGAGLFLILLVVQSRRVWLARSICAIVCFAVLAFGAWAVLRAGPAGQAAGSKLGRSIIEHASRSGTIEVRLLIWGEAAQLLTSNPVRMVFGYGMETLYYALARFYAPELAYVEIRGNLADRCHNNTFDMLLSAGVPGLGAEIVLILAFIVLLGGGLGLLPDASARKGLTLSACVGALAGWSVPYLVVGNLQLSGIGMPAGFVAGMGAYLLLRAARGLPTSQAARHPHHWLLAALCVGGIAHYIEIQFGIATISTRLCFWLFAGLAAALVPLSVEESRDKALDGYERAGVSDRSRREVKNKIPKNAGRTEMFLGCMVGLIMIFTIFDLYMPQAPLRLKVVPILPICLGCWLFGLVLLVEKAHLAEVGTAAPVTFLSRYVISTVGVLIPFLAIYLPWEHWTPDDTRITDEILRQAVLHIADGVLILYVFVLVILAAIASILMGGRRTAAQAAPGGAWKVVVLVLMLAGCAVLIVRNSLDYSRADLVAKQAFGYAQSGRPGAAVVLFNEALRMQPGNLQFRRDLGDALVLMARKEKDARLQKQELERAQSTLVGLWEENRVDFADAWSVADVNRMLMGATKDGAEQARLRLETDQYFRSAIELFPANVSILNDFAVFILEQGDMVRANELADKSMRIDDRFHETYLLRASIHARERSYALALQDYERALTLSPQSAVALNGRATMQKLLQPSEGKGASDTQGARPE
jgi:tetratricopeptide (TPR) repeat protein